MMKLECHVVRDLLAQYIAVALRLVGKFGRHGCILGQRESGLDEQRGNKS